MFEARVTWLDGRSIGGALEFLFVWLPLAFHALYGVVLAFERTGGSGKGRGRGGGRGDGSGGGSPYPGTRFRLLLRVSGLASLLFIAWHSWELPIARIAGRVLPEDLYDLAASSLSSTMRGVPWHAVGYFCGLFATVFHFTYGCISFAWSRGATDAQSLRRWTFRFAALGTILFLAGGVTILSLATGWPRAAEPTPPAAPCP